MIILGGVMSVKKIVGLALVAILGLSACSTSTESAKVWCSCIACGHFNKF
jgi:hypothetical protein